MPNRHPQADLLIVAALIRYGGNHRGTAEGERADQPVRDLAHSHGLTHEDALWPRESRFE